MREARLLSLDHGWMVGPGTEVASMGTWAGCGRDYVAALDRTC